MSFTPVNSLRKGAVIKYNGDLLVINNFSHQKPGKGVAYLIVDAKNLLSKKKQPLRLRASDSIEEVFFDEIKMKFLYEQQDQMIFMDDNYEQHEINIDILDKNARPFLLPNLEVTIFFLEDKALLLKLPKHAELSVKTTESVVSGQTATSSYKPAILENDVRVMVPPFINIDDKIKVLLEDITYVERVKNKK